MKRLQKQDFKILRGLLVFYYFISFFEFWGGGPVPFVPPCKYAPGWIHAPDSHKVEKGVSAGHLKNCYYPIWHQVNVMDSSQAIHLLTNFLENRTPLFHKERHGNLGVLK